MQYSIVGNDIALIMHYRALLKRADIDTLILPAIILKIFSFHDELAEHPMAGQTSMKGDNFPNYGGKDQCIYM